MVELQVESINGLKIWNYLGQDIATLLQDRFLELDDEGKTALMNTLLQLEANYTEVATTEGEDVFAGIMQEALLRIMDDLLHEVNDLKKECYSDMEAQDRSKEDDFAESMLSKI